MKIVSCREIFDHEAHGTEKSCNQAAGGGGEVWAQGGGGGFEEGRI